MGSSGVEGGNRTTTGRDGGRRERWRKKQRESWREKIEDRIRKKREGRHLMKCEEVHKKIKINPIKSIPLPVELGYKTSYSWMEES